MLTGGATGVTLMGCGGAKDALCDPGKTASRR
jgi:hypothetical protein